MSKYDWANVPESVNWIATDRDGIVILIKDKFEPRIKECLGIWDCSYYARNHTLNDQYQGNWRESLEKRPRTI